MQGLKRGHTQKLSEQSHRLLAWLKRNSVSDLYVSSVSQCSVPWSSLFTFNEEIWMPLQPHCAFHSERLADELQPWDCGGQYSRFGCFYLLCLSERLQLLWFGWVTQQAAAENNVVLLPPCGYCSCWIDSQNDLITPKVALFFPKGFVCCSTLKCWCNVWVFF